MPQLRAATSAPPTCVFRVRILGGAYAPPGARKIWREIELRADQTLADLGELIPAAFGFDDDHLWSFFLSGKPWDQASEYARTAESDPLTGARARGANRLRVRDAPADKEFLFLFDYGDEWHFGVKLVRTGEVERGARYPRVVASRGEAPPQYPQLEDEDDWDDDQDEDDWDQDDWDQDDLRLPLGVGLSEPEPPEFPPVELRPREELRAAAAAAPTVRRLRTLVEWVGAGRKLTPSGNLTVADGKELAGLLGLVGRDQPASLRVRSSQDIAGLEPLLGWAKGLRLVRVYQGRLVVVKQHRRLLDDPLELVSQAVDVLPSFDWAAPVTSLLASAFPGGLAEALLDLLSQLYAPEEPVSLGDLAVHFWEEHVEAGILAGPAPSHLDLWRMATAVETVRLVSQLQGLGMAEFATEPPGDGGPDVVEVVLGDVDESLRSVDAFLAALAKLPLRLTPLGIWQANVLLNALGAVAPVVGELAGKDAAALIESVADYDEPTCRAELRAWCEQRGAAAARELAAYARAAPGFEQRMLAFVGLEEAGPAAEAEVRAMLADPALRPHAQMWLVQRGVEDEGSLDPASATLLMAETLATILDADGPAGLVEHVQQLGPPDEQASVLANLWRAQTPRAATVLETIGKAHPSAKVAKAARKAAFKLRSSGAHG